LAQKKAYLAQKKIGGSSLAKKSAYLAEKKLEAIVWLKKMLT